MWVFINSENVFLFIILDTVGPSPHFYKLLPPPTLILFFCVHIMFHFIHCLREGSRDKCILANWKLKFQIFFFLFCFLSHDQGSVFCSLRHLPCVFWELSVLCVFEMNAIGPFALVFAGLLVVS